MNNEEFTQIELDLITSVYDNPNKYDIKIDAANQVCLFNKTTDKAIYKLGNIDITLITKLFKYMDIDITTDDSIRVIEKVI